MIKCLLLRLKLRRRVQSVVEETIRDLKTIPGFQSYLILNNDGIVIKYENMSYRTAVHYSHQVLGLASKATKYIRDLFDAPDNEVESIRLHCAKRAHDCAARQFYYCMHPCPQRG